MRQLIFGLLIGLGGALSADIPPPVRSALIEGNDQFTLDFYQKIANAPGNLIVSPFSLSAALAIPYFGAKGLTAQEMVDALYYPHVKDSLLAETFTKLMGYLAADEGSQYELRATISLWGDEELELTKAFRALIDESYEGGFQEVDFSKPKKARQEINNWAKEQTAGKINDLLQEGSVSPKDKLISTSALYLRANWAFPFDSRKTKTKTFQGRDGKKLQVEMMQGQIRLPHFKGDAIEVIALPYQGGKEGAQLALLLLLPKNGQLKDFESSLTLDQIKEILSAMSLRTVDVMLPKFQASTRVYANKILESLGMKLPFSTSADFSGINGKQDLLLNAAVHQAYIDVDEYGSESTAASVAAAGIKSAPPEKGESAFIADHPFMTLILDATSGQILFIGRIENPTSSL